MTSVDIAAVIISSTKDSESSTKKCWIGDIRARVISVLSDRKKVPLDKEDWLSILRLTGTEVDLRYSGPIMPKMSLRSGILFRLSVSHDEVEQALELVSLGKIPQIRVNATVIRPMAEPCVRVPLSILKELRGQEVGVEYSRLALVQAWAVDRRTGTGVSNG